FSSRRRHTRSKRDWSSDVCSSDLMKQFSIPSEDAPGRSYIGFIIFDTSLFTKAITPNSENIADIPPAKTATAIKYRQTFIKRSYDVSIIVFIIFVPPIIDPI